MKTALDLWFYLLLHAGAACQNAMSESDVVQRGGDGDALVMSELEPLEADSESGSESDSSCEPTTDLECSESGAESDDA